MSSDLFMALLSLWAAYLLISVGAEISRKRRKRRNNQVKV